MSALALEIDHVIQQLDAASAHRLERLLREVIDLVRQNPPEEHKDSSLRFPLVRGADLITSGDVAKLQDEH